jgi:hypothetical protein
MDRCVRITAKMSLGAYDIFEDIGELPEPEWLPLHRRAFRLGYRIDQSTSPLS